MDDALAFVAGLYRHLLQAPESGEQIVGVLAESQNFSSVSQQLESFGLLVDEDPTSRRIEFRTPPVLFI
jgi:hypothetical protein